MRGTVGPDWRPWIEVEFIRADQSIHKLRLLVDTGFNRQLTIRRNHADAWNLALVDTTRATLADGSEIDVEVRRALVNWNGERRMVAAYITDGDPSIGLAMMEGCRLQIDVTLGGRVTLESMFG